MIQLFCKFLVILIAGVEIVAQYTLERFTNVMIHKIVASASDRIGRGQCEENTALSYNALFYDSRVRYGKKTRLTLLH